MPALIKAEALTNLHTGILLGVIFSGLAFIALEIFTNRPWIPNDQVTLKVVISTDHAIDSLVLTSLRSHQTIEIKGETKVVFTFPNPGEGTYRLCCHFKDGRELCSSSGYLEAGYKPKLSIRDNEIKTVRFF